MKKAGDPQMERMQRFQKWIQQTFFGVENQAPEKEQHTDSQQKKSAQPPQSLGQRMPHTYSSFQEPSDIGPRVTYQYAKSAGNRYATEVEDEAKHMMETRKQNKQSKEEKKEVNIGKEKSSNSSSDTSTSPKKRGKFNNPDFKPTEIPSPIHGFRKVRPSQRTQLTLHQPEPIVETLPPFMKEKVPQKETFSLEETRDDTLPTVDDLQIEEATGSMNVAPVEEKTQVSYEVDSEIEEAIEPVEEHSVNEIATESFKVDSEDVDTPESYEVTSENHTTLEVVDVHSPIEEVVEEYYSYDDEERSSFIDDPEATVEEEEEEEYVQLEEPIQWETPQTDTDEQETVTSPTHVQPNVVTETKKETAQVKATESSHAKPKKKGASVPFNVIMLPKDKQTTSITKSSSHSTGYNHPNIQLLKYPEAKQEKDTGWMEEQALLLEETLQSFHVDAKVVHTTMGPSVTRFEIQPARGVKVNKVTNLSDDIKMALSAKEIRIEAPIPGKNTIGIEVPNQHSEAVWLREILRRDVFIQPSSPMTVALGLDISGQPIVTDLRKMPHGLVAGATGSGKSVCINSILISLLFKATPDEVKMLLIDPKMVELAPYNDVPHLVAPVVTDAKQATIALKWAVAEMDRRYEQFSEKGVRDVSRYNELYSENPDKPAMPYILVVIDELADLMMVAPQDVEDSICRIAQKARACGIHLLVATQRPSVDVITGLIKANIPTRIAFSVSSQTDSRTILDMNGAERLLGRGDMLFGENGSPKPVRVQGTFVTDEEIEDVISYVKKQRKPEFLLDLDQMQRTVEHTEQEDDLFEEACHHVINQGNASASNLQRRFRIGYNRAARLIDMLESRGVITGAMGSKPRQVLVDELSLDEILGYSDN